MEKIKQNWFKTILRDNKPLELIKKTKTTPINKFNLAGAISIFMILLLSATFVFAGNVTMQAGDFDIDGNVTAANLDVIGDINTTGNIILDTGSYKNKYDEWGSSIFELGKTSASSGEGKIGLGTYYTGAWIQRNWGEQEVTITGGRDAGSKTMPIVITAYTNKDKDHDHATDLNPVLFINSQTDPDTNNTQWMSLIHDTNYGIIDSGIGTIMINDSLNVIENATFEKDVKVDGKLCIGCTSTSYVLDVTGDIRATNNILANNRIGVGSFTSPTHGVHTPSIKVEAAAAQILFVDTSGGADDFQILANEDVLYLDDGSTTTLTVTGGTHATPNSVGIKNLNPSTALEIGDGTSGQENITLHSPDNTSWSCGVDNSGIFSCS